jgi:hypothetical protein
MRIILLSYKNLFCGRRAAVWAALICLALSAASCRTLQTVGVPVPIHDTTYLTKNVHDSVFVENTIKEFVKGDTVFLVETKIKYKEKLRVDTIMTYKEVPVELKIETTKFVEKELNWLQKTLIGFGVCFIISVLIAIAIFILGLKKK